MSQTANTPAVTHILADFVLSSDFANIPNSIVDEATRALVNWVGCAVGGSRHETIDALMGAMMPFAGPPQASILGRGVQTDILTAALMNGTSSHVDDFDDTHLKTAIHPSGPVLSAILALAERQPVNGRDFLHAMIWALKSSAALATLFTRSTTTWAGILPAPPGCSALPLPPGGYLGCRRSA